MNTGQEMMSQRDLVGSFIQKLEELEKSHSEKVRQDLLQHFDQILAAIDEEERQAPEPPKKRRSSYINLVLAFVVGLVVALVPNWHYISTLVSGGDSLSFGFVPNAEAYRKPIYDQWLGNAEQVAQVKRTQAIAGHERASVGAMVSLGPEGLFLIPADVVKASDMHVREIGPQPQREKEVDGYAYIPNTLVTFDSYPVQVIQTDKELEMAKKASWLHGRQLLAVGSIIQCSKLGICAVQPQLSASKQGQELLVTSHSQPLGDFSLREVSH